MSFFAFYPPGGGGGSNASVGLNGQTAPTSSTEVAGINPEGDLTPISVDDSGNQNINIVNFSPTAALPIDHEQVLGTLIGVTNGVPSRITNGTAFVDPTQIRQLTSSDTVTVVQPTGTNLHTVVDASALPSGAATAANQSTEISSLATIVTNTTKLANSIAPINTGSPPNTLSIGVINTSGDLEALPFGQGPMTASLPVVIASDQSNIGVTVSNFPATQPVSGTVTVVQPTGSNLHVQVDASALPGGASTAALQTSGNATLTSIDAGIPAALGQTTASASMPVVLASDQTIIPIATVDLIPSAQNITVVDSGSSTVTGFNNQPLITGTPTAGSAASFAVSSKESVAFEIKGTWTGSLQFEVSIDGGTTWTIHGAHQFGSPNFVTVVTANFIASLNMAGKTNFRVRATAAVTGTAAVQVVETVNPSTVYIANSLKLIDSTASATPTGMTIKSGATAPIASDSAIVVSLSPNSSGSIKVAGSAKANDPTFNTNSSSNITTSAYLQLVASTTSAATAVEIYNQSASSIYFATGAAASEINQFIIPPGGNGRIPFTLAASTRVSVKAVDVTATTGSLIVNYWT